MLKNGINVQIIVIFFFATYPQASKGILLQKGMKIFIISSIFHSNEIFRDFYGKIRNFLVSILSADTYIGIGRTLKGTIFFV